MHLYTQYILITTTNDQYIVKFDLVPKPKRSLLHETDIINHNQMKIIFKQFIKDETDMVLSSDFNDVMISLGITLEEAEINEMSKALDTDNDGYISYQDYMKLMSHYPDISYVKLLRRNI